MTKEEIAHITEVMTAFTEGKQIQWRNKNCTSQEWTDTLIPSWNFASNDYRVKPEPTCRPYVDAAEFIEAMRVHGPYLKKGSQYYYPINIDNDFPAGVSLGENKPEFVTFGQLMNDFTWQDNCRCQVAEQQ